MASTQGCIYLCGKDRLSTIFISFCPLPASRAAKISSVPHSSLGGMRWHGGAHWVDIGVLLTTGLCAVIATDIHHPSLAASMFRGVSAYSSFLPTSLIFISYIWHSGHIFCPYHAIQICSETLKIKK